MVLALTARDGGARHQRRVLISAHAGFPRWLDAGADFIEIDVRRDDRGTIVDSHDQPGPGADQSTLDEILDAINGQIGLHLDMKEAGYEAELIGRVLERLSPDKIVATPDFEDSIRVIKHHFPQVRVSPIDFVAIEQQSATEEVLRSSPMPIWIWTVDDPRRMRRFMEDSRIEGLITNRPDLALKLRARS